ncbi:hypothetical protein B0H10DRAFT_1938063 [Mycena sp. CBHHK59/15]|nr:hypothetical protein B0H10DRAFT_1938063 [Mycena sp. CBHHK59/15]
MAAPSWKHFAASTAPPTMPLLSSKTSFAVDASGSTAGAVMQKQKEFVLGMTDDSDFPASVTMWGSAVDKPIAVKETVWRQRNWGTSPDVLFRDADVARELKACDMWYLLTDGDVPSPVEFARKTLEVGMANTPVVFVITTGAGARPSMINISVGISVFASAPDAAIVFKDMNDGKIFVVAAKGAFEVLSAGAELDLEKWESLPRFNDEAAFRAALKDVNIVGVAHRANNTAVDLGRAWQAKHGCLVDVDALLAEMVPQSIPQDELIDLLEEEAFDALSLVCKTRGLLPTLRDWLLARKERASVVEIRDVSGAAEILQQLRDADTQTRTAGAADALRQNLRTAHQRNLEDYRARLTQNQPSPLLPHVNRALATLTALEKAGYRADILDRRSNRAMRAAVVTAADVDEQLAALDLEASVDAHRATCPICCSDDVIMSLALKASAAPPDNTTDFALNWPLAAGAAPHNRDVVSAQYVCFQCALAMHQMDACRGSMYNEPIAAVLPLAKFEGVNRKYITGCLAAALTGGLATGAAGLVQVLMGVLLTTMQTREWAMTVTADADAEVAARRAGMLWMLRNLIANASTRETFDETGKWVPFATALRWTLRAFEEEGIYSWTVRYPVPGFLLLLDLLKLDGVEVPENLRIAKLVHEIVTVYMARIVKASDDKVHVQRRILKIVFSEFNAEGVPRDVKNNALAINSPDVVIERLTSWLGLPASTTLIQQIGSAGAVKYAPALQYLAFRLFFEDNHQTPKGYLQRAAESDVHMHTATTKPQDLTAAVVGPLFTSMWEGLAAEASHNDVTEEAIPPFVSPYGPSVLHCGARGCGVRFDTDGTDADAVRKARAVHLAQAYAIKGRVLKNVSGMPENTGRLAAPTSTHINLHSSVAKSWRSLDKDARHAVLREVAPPGSRVDVSKPRVAAFVVAVMDYVCLTSGRGNIYSTNLRKEVEWVLASFFTALHTAAVRKELADDAELELVENALAVRIQWELNL